MLRDRKRLVRGLVGFIIVVIVLVSLHLLINNLDLPELLRRLHGG